MVSWILKRGLGVNVVNETEGLAIPTKRFSSDQKKQEAAEQDLKRVSKKRRSQEIKEDNAKLRKDIEPMSTSIHCVNDRTLVSLDVTNILRRVVVLNIKIFKELKKKIAKIEVLKQKC